MTARWSGTDVRTDDDNNLPNIKTPAQDQAHALKAEFGLLNHGLTNLRQSYWNLPSEALYEEIVFRGEAKIAAQGPIVVASGKHTARAAQDKYIVREPSSEDHVWWGEYNRPLGAEKFEETFSRLQGYLQGRDVFVQDCYVGAHPDYRLPIRIITEYAWHALFARNMFIRRRPARSIACTCRSSQCWPYCRSRRSSHRRNAHQHGDRHQLRPAHGYHRRLRQRTKKPIFTDEPLAAAEGLMTMHCSANKGNAGTNDVALFSGCRTGKTTLSADLALTAIRTRLRHGVQLRERLLRRDPALAAAEPQICGRKIASVRRENVYDL